MKRARPDLIGAVTAGLSQTPIVNGGLGAPSRVCSLLSEGLP